MVDESSKVVVFVGRCEGSIIQFQSLISTKVTKACQAMARRVESSLDPIDEDVDVDVDVDENDGEMT
jgi:hypothetical protein